MAHVGSSTLLLEINLHTGDRRNLPILLFGVSTKTSAPRVTAPTGTLSRVFRRPSSKTDNK